MFHKSLVPESRVSKCILYGSWKIENRIPVDVKNIFASQWIVKYSFTRHEKTYRGPSFRSLYISRPAEEKFQVKVRLIEEMILTLAGQSQRLSNWPAHIWEHLSCLEHCAGIAEVMGSNPVEDTWKFFRCTYEKIAGIVQQVWGSFLQFISQPHFTSISLTKAILF